MLKFQMIASIPYAPSSSGQITRPKPLPFRNPAASTEAQNEFIGSTYSLKWALHQPSLVSHKSYLINYHTSTKGWYDQGFKLPDHLANITFFCH